MESERKKLLIAYECMHVLFRVSSSFDNLRATNCIIGWKLLKKF